MGLIGPILFMVYRTKLDGKEQIVVDGMNRIFRDPLFVKGVLDLFVKLSEKYPSTEDKMHPQFEEAISGAPLYFDGSGQNFYFVSHMSDRGITNERILPKSSADARKKELIRTLETFHGTGDPVENRGTVELQNLEMGDVLGKFGELITIGYRNDRLNEPATYIHSFNDPLESKHFKDFQRPADAALKKAAGNPRSTGEREKALQRMDAEMSKGPLLFVHDDLSTFQFQAEIGANRITPVR